MTETTRSTISNRSTKLFTYDGTIIVRSSNTADGGRVRVEVLGGRTYDLYAFRDGRPEQRRVAVLFRDITGHRHAEEECIS
jgi:hypothetical protein